MNRKKDGITIYNTGSQKTYNRLATQFVENHFLQTEIEGASGYQNSEADSGLPDGWKPWTAIRKIIEDPEPPPAGQADRFQVEKLGPYERTVLSAIVWGDLNTIIIAGERGSGKTALVKELATVLQSPRLAGCALCGECEKPILIRFDFNHEGDFEEPGEIKTAFLIEMREVLQASLRKNLERPAIMKSLLEYLRERQGEQVFSAFDGLLGQIDRDRESWKGQGNKGRVILLYEYIDTRPGGQRRAVELLMAVARFFRDRVNRDNACFVMIIDNLDVVVPEAQLDLLVMILALQRTARIRTIVPLRWSTFEQIRGQAAYSYGVVPHRGPGIKKILAARLSFYLNNWGELPDVKALDSPLREQLRRRMEYLNDNLDKRLGDHLQWLSGRGVKLGLKITPRIFVNATVPYDRDPTAGEDLVRALYVGVNREQIMDARDPLLLNIFSDPLTQKFSLLGVRILQLLLEFRSSPPLRTAANLTSLLLRTGIWEEEDITAFIRALASTERPLIFIDGSSLLQDKPILNLRKVVFLTKMGEHYVTRLMAELTYFQEAAVCLRWPRGTIASVLNYRNAIDRFAILRSCIKVLREQDISETRIFIDTIEGSRYSRDIGWTLYSSRLMYVAARVFLRILIDRQDYSYEVTASLRDWLSLLLQSNEEEQELFGAENARLVNLVGDYQNELRDWRRREPNQREAVSIEP